MNVRSLLIAVALLISAALLTAWALSGRATDTSATATPIPQCDTCCEPEPTSRMALLKRQAATPP